MLKKAKKIVPALVFVVTLPFLHAASLFAKEDLISVDQIVSQEKIEINDNEILNREKRSGTIVVGKYYNNNRTKGLKNKLTQRFSQKYKEPNGHAIQRAFERGVSDEDIINTMEHGKKYRDPINDSKIYYLATTGIAVAEGYDTVKKEYFLKTVMSNVLKPGQNWNPIL
ncbi:DUF4258 domain-containing protein [Bacillus cereus]|uniref:DUF4258 domain-containing protein n=1 Tax=Bacillus cereus TaxID=1396 RepID=UPI0018CF4C66|nr:DUF4258 domain-containing protein [Bacillus cereus]MBG9615756.1 hypothetical protein [Bacillus cereus]